MNRNAASKLSRAHGAEFSYDVKARQFIVTRRDGQQFRLDNDALFSASADDFRRRFLEVPK